MHHAKIFKTSFILEMCTDKKESHVPVSQYINCFKKIIDLALIRIVQIKNENETYKCNIELDMV